MAESVATWKGFAEKGESRDVMMKDADEKIGEAYGDYRRGDGDDDDFVPLLDYPLRFYGPDGALHYAFYDWLEHGLEDLDLKEEGEDDRQWDESGEPKRPSYRTAQDQSRDEINWGRWPREPVANPDNDYPQKDVMGSWDFNDPEEQQKVRIDALDNFEKKSPEELYPKGIKLLKSASTRHNGQEWLEGQPLGPDPKSRTALRKHLGWIPERMRKRRVGLGGDITDSVAEQWFHGNFRARFPANFKYPAEPWSEDPARVVIMHREGNLRHQFKILSKPALQAWIKRQPAPAPPAEDAFEDAVEGMNLFGTAPYVSKAKHKVGQREAAHESLRMLAEGAPKSEVKLNCR